MSIDISQVFIVCMSVVFLTTVLLHVTKKNATLATMYAWQSMAVAGIIFAFAYQRHSMELLYAGLLTLGLKAIVTPMFFSWFITRYHLKFSHKLYVKLPVALTATLLLVVFVQSSFAGPLTVLSPAYAVYALAAVSSILISLLLIINRKEALPQVIGMVSLENGIVAFATFLNMENTFSLELGIAFDLVAWIIVASAFIRMVHRVVGSLDVSTLSTLQE